MTPTASGELERLLAPAFATVDRLPPELGAALREGIQSVECVVELASAQADAAERRATDARAAAEATATRTAAIECELTALARTERERWQAVLEVLAEHEDALAVEEQVDRLVHTLDVRGPVESAAAFRDYMDDRTSTLRLGPDTAGAASGAEDRLALIARRVERAPLSADESRRLLLRTSDPSQLRNADGCGLVCVDRGLDRQLVLLGDGTALSVSDKALRRMTPTTVELAQMSPLATHRWVTGAPPLLLAHARAGYAVCLDARKARLPIDRRTFGPWLMLGAALAIDSARPSAMRLAQSIRAVFTTPRAGLASALLGVVHETMRVTVYRTGDQLPSPTPAAYPSAIDVGRVRWCELSHQPVMWLPLMERNPDQVGGADRPWTMDPPAAGATWQAESPGLRVDREWHARIVVVPGTPNLWVLAPDGGWWSLDSDFEAILLSRREHVKTWLDALEVLDAELPARIGALDATSTNAPAPDNALTRIDDGRSDRAEHPARFSREWVQDLASRYEYSDDSDVRAAGARAAKRGHYTRDEFLSVVRWKSARSVPRASRNSAASVERETRAALAAEADELTRVTSLLRLEGVGIPVASALLHFTHPERYPILDYRALETLGDNRRRTQYQPRFWLGYLDRCRRLAEDAGVSLRELDKALWQASREAADRRRECRRHPPRPE